MTLAEPAARRRRDLYDASGRGRAHRLAERLFTDVLSLRDEEAVESNACQFEHILSPELTDRICTFLGHPETCPHGSPIPRGKCCLAKATMADSDNLSGVLSGLLNI